MSVVNSRVSRSKFKFTIFFTRYGEDIRGVNASIRFAILPSVVECESQEGRRFIDFGRFGTLSWLLCVALTDRETNTRMNIYSRMSTNPENLVKIGLVGSEISLLQAIVKKQKE